MNRDAAYHKFNKLLKADFHSKQGASLLDDDEAAPHMSYMHAPGEKGDSKQRSSTSSSRLARG